MYTLGSTIQEIEKHKQSNNSLFIIFKLNYETKTFSFYLDFQDGKILVSDVEFKKFKKFKEFEGNIEVQIRTSLEGISKHFSLKYPKAPSEIPNKFQHSKQLDFQV